MAWKIRLRDNEDRDDQPFLSPDLVITQGEGPEIYLDFALADADEKSNRMGLRSKEGLHTAILIQIFTDKRALPDMPLIDDLNDNPRGWWGDSIGLDASRGETEIGSWLWTLQRSELTDQTAQRAADYVQDCLQPLIDQGAVARFEIATTINRSIGLLGIDIKAFSRDGSKVYSQEFQVLWEQIGRLSR